MDFNATIDLIIRDLDEAREIIDDLKKYPGVPHLQVELAKAKCKSAGEVIALLKQEAKSMKDDNTGKKTGDAIMNTGDADIKTEDTIITTDDLNKKSVFENQESDSTFHPSEISESKTDHPASKTKEHAIIGDSFSHLSARFNEQLGNRNSNEDLSSIMVTKHVSSLSEAIGINDRFLFIREIFDGNKDAYSQAIKRLDSAENIADAKAVIMSYTGNSFDNEAVKQLLDLVKRKLPANE